MTLPSSGPLSLNDIQGEFGGSNPIGINEYYAGGGLVPAGTSGTYGAVPTSGQISIQNFYGTSNFVPVYIEDVFSTWLYDGNSSTQTITNGINLSGSGGMVWIKDRNSGAKGHQLWDTSRGVGYRIQTQSAVGQNTTQIFGVSSFNSNGFTLGSNNDTNDINYNFASWTFRKQPKFFDVVKYTGNGVNGRNISHNLGSVPGCIIVKNTSNSENWAVYHRSNHSGGNDPQNYALYLNTTAGTFGAGFWNNTAPTSTVFTVANDSRVNTSGDTYVAYLFAHNAGGFGLTGTDNVISCGSYTTDPTTGFSPFINLGYEPQWILYKQTNTTNNWQLVDNMRGLPAYTDGNNLANNPALFPNLASAESSSVGGVAISSTGFYTAGATSSTYIYIAIRRGPMKTPTSGTSVFVPQVVTSYGTATTTGFPVSMQMIGFRNGSSIASTVVDRLRGVSTNSTYATSPMVVTSSSNNESFYSTTNTATWNNTGFTTTFTNTDGPVYWSFQRAPGFFDEVCYTGTGSATTFNHNLGVAPELMLVKSRNLSRDWICYSAPTGNTSFLKLNSINQAFSSLAGYTNYWNNTSPTSSVFSVNTSPDVNGAGNTYVAYLFATVSGVSKVGSYTGNGGTQTINCGFSGGARFVLIKISSNTGGWYVFDTARGMVSGTDPRLQLNNTNAEANANVCLTTTGGFQVVNTLVNTTGETYIYLAIA